MQARCRCLCGSLVSGTQKKPTTNKQEEEEEEEEEGEREIYALFACFCFPGCYAKRFMFPRSGVPACARMHEKPPGVKVVFVAS